MPHPASHKHSASNLESQLRAHGAKLFVTDLSLALQAEKKKSEQLFAVNCRLEQSHFRAVSLLRK